MIKNRPVVFATVVLIVLLAFIQLCFPEWFRIKMPECIGEGPDGKNITIMAKVSKIKNSEYYGKKTTTIHVEDAYLMSQKGSEKAIEAITEHNQSIICYLSSEENLKIGNTVLLRGKIKFFRKARNPGEFDFQSYYYNRAVLFSIREAELLKVGKKFCRFSQILYEIQLRSERILEKYLPKEKAAVMKVLLLGEKEKLDEETRILYQKNGIAHILAISGLHISMIGMGIVTILSFFRMPLSLNCVCSIILLILFGLMVGLGASTLRAIFMFSMMLLAKILKRSYDMLTAVALAALFLLIRNPLVIQDCSFQLSFAAILGIGIVYPAFQLAVKSQDDFIWKISFEKVILYKIINGFLNAFLPSLAVTLTTAPILIYYFHEISFLSVLLNLIVLPFLFFLLSMGICMIFIGNIFWNLYAMAVRTNFGIIFIDLFEKIIAHIISSILEFYQTACLLFQSVPIGRVNVEMPDFFELIFYYFILIYSTIIVNRKRQIYQFYICLLLLTFIYLPSKPEFSIWNLDVGQGDCNVIFTEDGKTYIIDCGSSSRKEVGKYVLIPFLKSKGCNEIEGIFVSHLDQDHWNGIVELMKYSEQENLPVKKIYFYEKEREKGMDLFQKEMKLEEKKIASIHDGYILKNRDFMIRCLYPCSWQDGLEGNAASLVLQIQYKDFKGLFMGDLEREGEEILVSEFRRASKEQLLKSHYLKVGHHGSNSSTYEKFLQTVEAPVATISVGKENPYGHPHKDLLQRLYHQNMDVYRTDLNGAIKISFKGDRLIVTTYL